MVRGDAILPLFHRRLKRRVDPTHSDLRIDHGFYRVDPQYRTLWVWVTYDPFAHGSGPPEQVDFWSEQGVYLGVAPRYERQRGAHEPITAAPPPTKLKESAYLRALQVEAHQQQQAARQDGINFHLRLLVSSAVESEPPLKILLSGQEALRQTLKRSEYTDIVHWISVRYQLRPLSKDQTHRYVDYQLTHGGGDTKIFDEHVKDLLYEFTGGNPRGINNAALACLLSATARRAARIDDEIFRQVTHELHWN